MKRWINGFKVRAVWTRAGANAAISKRHPDSPIYVIEEDDLERALPPESADERLHRVERCMLALTAEWLELTGRAEPPAPQPAADRVIAAMRPIVDAALGWVNASDGDRGTARQLVTAIRENRSSLTAALAAYDAQPVAPLTWTCAVCGEVHPIDHEGLFCRTCQATAACCGCELKFDNQCHTDPSNEDVDRVARVMIAEWARCEPTHGVTLHPTSYVATFADMARAVLRAEAKRSPLTSAEWGALDSLGNDIDNDAPQSVALNDRVSPLVRSAISKLFAANPGRVR